MGSVYKKLKEVPEWLEPEKYKSCLPLGPEGLQHGTLENGMR